MITITPWGGIFFGMGKSLQANIADQIDSDDLLIARQYSPHALTEYDGHVKEVVGFYKVDSDNTLHFQPIIPTHGRETPLDVGSDISSPYHNAPSSGSIHIDSIHISDPQLTPGDGSATFSPTESHTNISQSEAMHANANNASQAGHSLDTVAIQAKFISSGPSGAQQPTYVPATTPENFADVPSLITHDAVGRALSSIPLDVSAFNSSPDITNNLQVLISNLQAGDRFNVGHSLGNGQWLVDAKDLPHLQFMSPFSGERNLEFSASSQNGNASTSISHALNIQIEPQTLGVTSSAVAPALSAYFGQPSYGHGIPVLIALRGQDPMGDNLTLKISDVPEGAAFNHGLQIAANTWLFTTSQLQDLEYIPQEGFNSHTQFTLTAQTVNSLGQVAITHEILEGNIESGMPPLSSPTATDAPPLLITGLSAGVSDLGIPVNIQVYHQNYASTGNISITIDLSHSNLPSGTLFSAGTNNGDGTWTISSTQLHNLQISIPPDADDIAYNKYTLKVTASETFADGVTVHSQSVDLNLGVAESNNDLFNTLQSHIAGAAPATSHVTVTLSHMPQDALLVDSHNNILGHDLGNGVWEIAAEDLASMRILVPTPGNYNIQVSATETAQVGSVQLHGSSIASSTLPINTTGAYSFVNTPLFLDANGHVNFAVANGNVIPGGSSFDKSSGAGAFTPVDVTTLNPLDHTPTVSIPAGVGALTGHTIDLNLHATAPNVPGNQILSVTLSGLPLDAVITSPDGFVATKIQGADQTHSTWTISGNGGSLNHVLLSTQSAGDWNIQVTTTSTDPNTRIVSFMSEITNVLELKVFNSADPNSAQDLNTYNSQLGSAYTNALTTLHPSVVSPVMPTQFVSMAPETSNTPVVTPSYTANNAIFLDLDHLTPGQASVLSGDGTHHVLVLSGTENFTLTGIAQSINGGTITQHEFLNVNTATAGHFSNLQIAEPGQIQFTLTTSDHQTFQFNNISQIVWQAPPETLVIPPAPVVSPTELLGMENGAINLDLAIQVDPSVAPQDVLITIAGLTQGTLSSGYQDEHGNWHVSFTELPNLQLIPNPTFHGEIILSVSAQVKTDAGKSTMSTNQVLVHVLDEAAVPTLSPTADASGVVSQGIPINLNAFSNDAGFDPSNLQIVISNMQPGDTFNYGAPSADGQHWVINWQDVQTAQWQGGAPLQLLAPFAGHQNLLISASSQQGDGIYATVSQKLHVDVAGLSTGDSLSEQLNIPAALNLPPHSNTAVAPILQSDIGPTSENQPIYIFLSPTGMDPLQHDSITAKFSNLPEGGYFYIQNEDGTHQAVGAHIDANSWLLPANQLQGLYYQPPSSFSGDINFHIDVQTINGFGDSAVSSFDFLTTVYPSEIPNPPPYVPTESAPMIVAANAVGLSSLAVPLNIQVLQHDYSLNGSISVYITVPPGSYLSSGTQLSDQQWQLSPDQLHGLQFYMPPTGSQTSTEAILSITASETFVVGGPTYNTSTSLSVQLFDTAAHLVEALNPELSSQATTTPHVDPSFFQNLSQPVATPHTSSADLVHGYSIDLNTVDFGTVINGDELHGNTLILHGNQTFTLVGNAEIASGNGVSSNAFLNLNTAVQGKFSTIDVQEPGNTHYELTLETGKKIFFNNISHIVLNPEPETNVNLPLPATPTILTTTNASGFQNHPGSNDYSVYLGHLVASDNTVDPANVMVTISHLDGGILNIPNITYINSDTVQFRLSDVPAEGALLQPRAGFFGDMSLSITAQAMNAAGSSGIVSSVLHAEVLPVTDAPTNFNPHLTPDPTTLGVDISLEATSNTFLRYVISDLHPGDSFNVGYADPEDPSKWIVQAAAHLDPANPQIVYTSPFPGSHTFTIAAVSHDNNGGEVSIAKSISVNMPSAGDIVGAQIQSTSPADPNHFTTAKPPTLSFTAETQAADGTVNLHVGITDNGPLQYNTTAAMIYIHNDAGDSGSFNYGFQFQPGAWLLSTSDLARLSDPNATPLQYLPAPGFTGPVNFELIGQSTSIFGELAFSRDFTNSQISTPTNIIFVIEEIPSPAIVTPSITFGLWGQSVPLHIIVQSQDYHNTTITISGLPQTAALSAGVQTLDGMGNATWTIPQSEIGDLRLAFPNYGVDHLPLSLQISATENGNTTTSAMNLEMVNSVATLADPTHPISLPAMFYANNIFNVPSSEPATGYVLNLSEVENQQIGAVNGPITIAGDEAFTLTGTVTTADGLSHQFLSVSSTDHLSKIDVHEPAGTTVYRLTVGDHVATFTDASQILFPQTPAPNAPPVFMPEPIVMDVAAIPGNNHINLGTLVNFSPEMGDPSSVAFNISNLPAGFSLNLNPGAQVTLAEHSAHFHLSDIPPGGLVLTVPMDAIDNPIPLTVSMQNITDHGSSPIVTSQINANVLPVVELPYTTDKTAYGTASHELFPNIIIAPDTTEIVFAHLQAGDSFNLGHPDPDHPGQWIINDPAEIQNINTLSYYSPFSGDHAIEFTATKANGAAYVSITGGHHIVLDTLYSEVTSQLGTASTVQAPQITAALSEFSSDLGRSLNIALQDQGPLQFNNLRVEISVTHSGNVPDMGRFSAGVEIAPGKWLLNADELPGLQYQNAQSGTLNFQINAQATSILGQVAQQQISFSTIVNTAMGDVGVPQTPHLFTSPTTIVSSIGSTLPIEYFPLNAAENAVITISGLTNDMLLSHGRNNGDGSWSMSPADLQNLQIFTPSQSPQSIQVTVSATEGALPSVTSSFNLSVLPELMSPEGTPIAAGLPWPNQAFIDVNAPANSPSTGYSFDLSHVASYPSATLDVSGNNTLILTGNQSFTLVGTVITPDGNRQFMSISNDNHPARIDVNEPAGNTTYTLTVDGHSITLNNIQHFVFPQFEAHIVPPIPAVIPNINATNETILVGATDINLGNLVSVDPSVDPDQVLITLSQIPNGATLQLTNPVTITSGNAAFALSEIPSGGLHITLPHGVTAGNVIPLTVVAESLTESGASSGSVQTTINLIPTLLNDIATAVLDSQPHLSTITIQPVTLTSDSDMHAVFSDGDNYTVTIYNLHEGDYLNAGHADPSHPGQWIVSSAELQNVHQLQFLSPFAGTRQLKLSAVSANPISTDAVFSENLVIDIAPRSLGVPANIGVFDLAIPLSPNKPASASHLYQINLTSADHPLPAGSILSAGIDNHDGTWTLTEAQLTNLQISIPNQHADRPYVDYQYKIQALDANNHLTGTANTNAVTVYRDMQLMALEINKNGVLEMHQSYLPRVLYGDSSGPFSFEGSGQTSSEHFSVTIRDLPHGATVSLGGTPIEHVGNVWQTFNVADLHNLQISFPSPGTYQYQVTVDSIASTDTQFMGFGDMYGVSYGAKTAATSVQTVTVNSTVDAQHLTVIDPFYVDNNGTLAGTHVTGNSPVPPPLVTFNGAFGAAVNHDNLNINADNPHGGIPLNIHIDNLSNLTDGSVHFYNAGSFSTGGLGSPMISYTDAEGHYRTIQGSTIPLSVFQHATDFAVHGLQVMSGQAMTNYLLDAVVMLNNADGSSAASTSFSVPIYVYAPIPGAISYQDFVNQSNFLYQDDNGQPAQFTSALPSALSNPASTSTPAIPAGFIQNLTASVSDATATTPFTDPNHQFSQQLYHPDTDTSQAIHILSPDSTHDVLVLSGDTFSLQGYHYTTDANGNIVSQSDPFININTAQQNFHSLDLSNLSNDPNVHTHYELVTSHQEKYFFDDINHIINNG